MTQTIGRYELKKELGRGGMATVFLAHDPRVERDVAVKLLPREFLHDPMFRGRFEREAKTVAGLEHEAIVPLYDFGEEDGQPYLVMRFMAGGSLVERIRKGPISLKEASKLLTRLATALDMAHAAGIIHRDLKPGNILLDQHANPFLSDFGIVKIAESTATFTGTGMIGTPTYMSPEQARAKKKIDHRSDIYALGVILFEMLTGRIPYEADTPMGVAIMHINEPVPSILEVKADLPAAVEEVIHKSLAKDPDLRYQSAAELAEALSAITEGRTVETPPAPETTVPEMDKTTFEQPTVEEPEPSATRYVPPPTEEKETRVEEPVPAAVLQEIPDLTPAPPRKGLPLWGWIGIGVIGIGIIAGGIAGAAGLFSAPITTPTTAVSTEPTSTETTEPSKTPEPSATAQPSPTTIPTFDPRSMVELATFTASGNFVRWSPGSDKIAFMEILGTNYNDPHVAVIDVSTGAKLFSVLSSPRTMEDLEWSSDGEKLASCGIDGRIQVWDASDGTELASIVVSTSNVSSVAWSPDSATLASLSSDGKIRFWDTQTWERIGEVCCHEIRMGRSGDLDWSPDGQRLASAGGDGKLKLWEVDPPNLIDEFCCTAVEWVTQVRWSPDGSYLLSVSTLGGGGSAQVWNIENRQPILTFTDPPGEIVAIDWSPDGKYIATGSSSYSRYSYEQRTSIVVGKGSFQVWDAESGAVLSRFEGTGEDEYGRTSIGSVAWSPDGMMIVTVGTGSRVSIWGMPSD